MKGPADVYRAEILRAVLGDKANDCKVVDIERLNTIAAHLVDCEDAKAILRAKGYGTADMTFVELAKSMPENVRGILRDLFRSHKLRAPASLRYPDLGEANDAWSVR
jgi:hypothetical protein